LPEKATAASFVAGMIVSALLLLASTPRPDMRCTRPAAPDEAAARRLARIMIVNRNRSGRPLPPYDLRIAPDPEDAGQWVAYQIPRASGSQLGGGGMSFRIDRCTGQITRITYQR
jgi:hypothetical protein